MMGQVETATTLASETVRELEAALSRIGVTRAHKVILVLILAGLCSTASSRTQSALLARHSRLNGNSAPLTLAS